jgi:hypothetical protein
MEKNNKVQLSCFLVLILFFTVVGVGSAFAHGGGGGGDGGGISDSVVKGVTIEGLETLLGISFDCDCNNNSIVDILEIDEVPVIYNLPAEDGIENPAGELVGEDGNTQSVDPTSITISIDEEGPNENDRAATIRNITAMVEALPYLGGIAVAYATAGSSVYLSALAGGVYAYTTSRLSGANEDDSRRGGVNSTLAGGAPGGPIGQAIAGEVLTQMQENANSYTAPTNNPRSGAELNSTTGQVTQR